MIIKIILWFLLGLTVFIFLKSVLIPYLTYKYTLWKSMRTIRRIAKEHTGETADQLNKIAENLKDFNVKMNDFLPSWEDLEDDPEDAKRLNTLQNADYRNLKIKTFQYEKFEWEIWDFEEKEMLNIFCTDEFETREQALEDAKKEIDELLNEE